MAASGKHPLRLVLLGKKGVGKSATGNTILGEKVFVSDVRASSVTQECTSHTKKVKKQIITIVDTPGLSNKDVTEEVGRTASLIAPGPHAVLLLLDVKHHSKEERNIVKNLIENFGEDVCKHMIIVFTHGDELESKGKTIEQYINEAGQDVQQMIAECGGRYHVFNNMAKDETQVVKFLEKIQTMLHENGNKYYNCEKYTLKNMTSCNSIEISITCKIL